MCEELKYVRYAVFRLDCVFHDGLVSFVDGVGHDDGFGIGINGPLAEEVLEGYTSSKDFFGE